MNPKPVIIAGLYAVLFVVAVYFGGRYTLEQRRAEYSKRSKRYLTKRETRRAVEPTETTENSPSNPPTTNALKDEQETSVISEPAPTVDIELSTAVEEAETPQTEDEPVSPHGFGSYPAIPDDYPHPPSWVAIRNEPEQELLERVRIKLWKQGIHTDGAIYEYSNGKIYPTIRGTVYVKWTEDGFGNRYVSEMNHHPEDDYLQIKEQLNAGETPHSIIILEHSEAGIDPYEFLNIK